MLLTTQMRMTLAVSDHCISELGINLVRDGHNVKQHLAEIHTGQVILQCAKNADLKESRLFHYHCHAVALFCVVVVHADARDGVEFRRRMDTQTVNQVCD